MTTTQLLQAAKESLESLPPEQLRVAAEFLKYLEERASDEAAEELLKIPGLLKDLEEAERDIAAGRTVNWQKDPRHHPNVKLLKGELAGRYRYRVGDHRVIY